jgi:hypothetical protein
MKPKILSEKELIEIIQPIFKATLNDGIVPMNWEEVKGKIAKGFSLANKAAVKAQLDADVAYYEPLIQQEIKEATRDAFSRIEKIDAAQQILKEKLSNVELAIQQAKSEVAREIFEEIERHRSCDSWGNPTISLGFYNGTGQILDDWYQSLKSKYGGQKK